MGSGKGNGILKRERMQVGGNWQSRSPFQKGLKVKMEMKVGEGRVGGDEDGEDKKEWVRGG